ncbi:hypothetical protein V6N13_088915 [Hibiscus sabdariffa]|uniref:Uncharacterized protein n=1 Tax=Hibiscus sabdariffa TaxID=183260 RepID=A0ABR2G0T2_9ROSI
MAITLIAIHPPSPSFSKQSSFSQAPQIQILPNSSPNPNPNPKPFLFSNLLSLALTLTLNSPLPSLAIPSLSSLSSPQAPPTTTPFTESKFLQLGLEDGKIRPCPSTNPGCISTNAKSSSFAFPWIIPESSKENAVQELQEAILKTQKNPKIVVVEDTPNGKYMQAEVDGRFGPDVMEFLVKGDVVTYRSMAMKVTYIYPFTTAIGDSKGQEERLKKIIDQLGWCWTRKKMPPHVSNGGQISPLVQFSNGGTARRTVDTETDDATLLTSKEFMVLSRIVRCKAPGNLLVFGLQSQYVNLSSINASGITVFLEDDPPKIHRIKAGFNGTRVYKVKYQTPAKKAYALLKHTRGNPACSPSTNLMNQSSCKLALRNLPGEIYKLKWDVVVVDGPTKDSQDAPGRMSTIYYLSEGMLARSGTAKTTTDVVHDVHRTIEKWFSGEFLCKQNLVSAKGKLWNFRISVNQSNSTSFCSSEMVHVMT